MKVQKCNRATVLVQTRWRSSGKIASAWLELIIACDVRGRGFIQTDRRTWGQTSQPVPGYILRLSPLQARTQKSSHCCQVLCIALAIHHHHRWRMVGDPCAAPRWSLATSDVYSSNGVSGGISFDVASTVSLMTCRRGSPSWAVVL